jgi:hypothetical protein
LEVAAAAAMLLLEGLHAQEPHDTLRAQHPCIMQQCCIHPVSWYHQHTSNYHTSVVGPVLLLLLL